MKNSGLPDLVVSGLGIVTTAGVGRGPFADALRQGRARFGVMRREGRQRGGSAFLGAELDDLACPEGIAPHAFRTASLGGQAALVALAQAWQEARLAQADPRRIGLVVGGSNLQQRDFALALERHSARPQYVRPSHAMTFLDSDLCGLCTEQFGIRGFWSTAGGASASGQLAVALAMDAVMGGRVDACIALGALTDLSWLECQAFTAAGAMGGAGFQDAPQQACRPFDRRREGFVFGEACAAVVVEREAACASRGAAPQARLLACSVTADANRRPNPSLEGEVDVIARALAQAGLRPQDVDYVNPHGSGSQLGDEVEAQALQRAGLSHARLNTTKSIVGHGLSATGLVELVATLVQMEGGWLHPSLNLEEPVAPGLAWVGGTAAAHRIRRALNLSIGFGGINTALCLERA